MHIRICPSLLRRGAIISLIFLIFKNCMTISVISLLYQIINTYTLLIYLNNRTYFKTIYLQRDPIKSKALIQPIASQYVNIWGVKEEKEREKRKRREMWHLMYLLFYRKGVILQWKSQGESVVFILSNFFLCISLWILFFSIKVFVNVSTFYLITIFH